MPIDIKGFFKKWFDYDKTLVGSLQKEIQARHVFNKLVDEIVKETGRSEDEAKQFISAIMVGEANKRGQNPDALFHDLPQEVQNFLKYKPDDLRRNQDLTLLGTIITVGAVLAAGVAAIFGAPLVAVGAIGGIGMLAQMVVNNWNDVFHWGPLMAEQNRGDIEKVIERQDTVGVTNYGQFKDEDIKALADAYKRATILGIEDPILQQSYKTDEEGIKRAMTSLIGQLNAQGTIPTKGEVISLLSGWTTPPEDQSRLPGGPGAVGSELEMLIKPTKAPPEVRKVIRVTKKPKMFLGTIFAGRLAPISIFKRKIDDLITGDEDLLDGAETNLARWLKHLPSKLTFEIQIKNNPFDEGNVKRPGIWAALALYITSRFGKRMFIDEILLGPLDPTIYYPETSRTLEISGTLPDFAKYADLDEAEVTALLVEPGAFKPVAGVPPVAPTPPPKAVPPPPPTPTPPSLEAPVIIDVVAHEVTVNVDALMVRSGPSRDYPLSGSQRLVRGNTFTVIGWTHGENVAGEDRWWKSQFGNFVWVGGTEQKPKETIAPTPPPKAVPPPVPPPPPPPLAAPVMGEMRYYKVTNYGKVFYPGTRIPKEFEYIASPWAGNIPFGQTPISKEEYKAGLEKGLGYGIEEYRSDLERLKRT